MSKVVVTLGDRPADCKLEIDGEMVPDVISIEASVSIEDAPAVTYRTMKSGQGGPEEEVNVVEFKPVVEVEDGQ